MRIQRKRKLKQRIMEMQKNEVRYSFEKADAPIPVGVSKVGGKPSAPETFEWPYYRGVGEDETAENRPLSFLMQIDLEEVHIHDEDNSLPESGLLLFFYECDSMCWGFDPEDKGCARVYYFDKGTKLAERDLPENLEAEFRVAEMKMSFSKHISLPSYEEFPDDDAEWDDYDEILEAAGCSIESIEEEQTGKMLGYPMLIQGSMQFECEAVSRGYSCGEEDENYMSEEETALIEERSKDWILLNQIGTLPSEDEDSEFMWGDMGLLYFWIRKQDLEKKAFDNIWLICQCY